MGLLTNVFMCWLSEKKNNTSVDEGHLLSTFCHLKGKDAKNKYRPHMRQNSIPT